MSVLNESELIKAAIKGVAKEVIEKETSSCFRVYKAIVVSPKTYSQEKGFVCGVKLVGDETVLYLPLSSATSNVQIGDLVWVATIANSFRNAIVWENRYFQEQNVQPKHYGARWDKTLAQLTRLYDAASFTTTTTNFRYNGRVNANYNNPFDDIYPWSGIKLCNIDIETYVGLTTDQGITECVVAWEGDPDFSYDHPNGVWRYRPAFYGKSWDDGTYRYFDVCASDLGGYVYYPENIAGRWQGVEKNLTINGESANCLIPTLGIIAGRGYDAPEIHALSKIYNATLDSIYSIDADNLLMIVEYATMNTQGAIGNGVVLLSYQPSTPLPEAATNSNVIKVPAATSQTYCIPGAVVALGASAGSSSIGTFYIVSVETDSENSDYLALTLNAPVTVTTSNYFSIQGTTNMADEEIGSKSGYLGTNSYANAYYRGIVMFGNGLFYTLGAYKSGSDQHVWIASSNKQSDEYDRLNTSVHTDTGLVVPIGTGYINALGMVEGGSLSIPPVCTATGGTYQNPIGDYLYNSDNSPTVNKILFLGGALNSGGAGGSFTQFWAYTTATTLWYLCGRPRLLNPQERG